MKVIDPENIDSSINVTDLEAGVYILRLMTAEGVKTEKFVKL
jgi:hypothetical protein